MQMKHWPSRRFQIVAIACIAAFVLLATLVPLAIPSRRAMRLYREAWFGTGIDMRDDSGFEGGGDAYGVARLRAALRIEPDNELYQQALVWKIRREDRPKLLKTAHLGRKASALAMGLMTSSGMFTRDHDDEVLTRGLRARLGIAKEGEKAPTQAEIDKALRERLAALSRLQAADPGNALPMYRKAYALSNVGRIDEAVEALQAGNRLPFRLYVPDVTPEVMDSIASPMFAVGFVDGAMAKQLVRILSESADQRLRSGDVDGARTILRACCDMGVNASGAKPESLIGYMIGDAVFAVAWSKLGPIDKDFGDQSGEAERGACAMRVIEAGQRRMEAQISDMMPPIVRQMTLLYALPMAAIGAAALLALTMVFGWLPSSIRRRRRGEAPVTVAPWSEGFLCRLGVCALALAIVCLMVAVGVEGTEGLLSPVMAIALATAPGLLVLCVSVFRLRRVYIEQTGERVGALRFIFGRFDSVGAWSRKYVSAALASYLLVLACAGALISGYTSLKYDSPPVSFAVLIRSTLHSEQSIARQTADAVAREWRR